MITATSCPGPDDRPEVEAYFQDIFERIRPRAQGLLYRYHIPRQDADDLLQQALLVLFTKYGEVRYPEAWILGTLRNQCLRYWRRHRMRASDPLDDDLLERLGEPLPPRQELGDLRRDLELAIARLPERHRAVLRLRFGFGLGAAEIASRLDYRPASIRKILNRCLAALGRELSGEGR